MKFIVGNNSPGYLPAQELNYTSGPEWDKYILGREFWIIRS